LLNVAATFAAIMPAGCTPRHPAYACMQVHRCDEATCGLGHLWTVATSTYNSQQLLAPSADSRPELADALLLRNLSHLPLTKWTARWLADRAEAPQCALSGYCRWVTAV